METCCVLFIDDHCSEVYHQNQNLAERRGEYVKTSIVKLYHHIPSCAPTEFWCYEYEFVMLV